MSSIWDLRQGDADDNRTSPHGIGWQQLIFSNALEFSYLKAALALVILIVIPALLVGVAPSIIVTYGRHTVATVATTGRKPTAFGFLLLGILILIALLIGRRFLSIVLDNFLHLHQTLVFPIFVALREVFRTISERLPGMTHTQQHLYRRRRIGTVFAALVLGGTGLALAMSVELSIGLQLVNVERVAPWAVARAALGNAAMVFGFSTAAASAFWLWRELSVSGPVLDWVPNLSEQASPVARVAHLSDLHFVGERYGFRMETGMHGPQGNKCIYNALQRLAEIHACQPVDCVLVTGDITDAGTRSEWVEFLDLMQRFPELRSRMCFVPGNHDINIVDRTNTARPDLPWSIGKSLRKLRVVLALDEIQGDRSHLVDHKSGTLGPSLASYLREGHRLQLLRDLAEEATWRGRWELTKVWNAMFPLVEPAREGRKYGLILLDSNAPSNVSLTNAIGVVNPTQLQALRSFLSSADNRAWLILLHHQIVEYPVLGISLSDRIGLALMNAADLLATISPHAERVLILHGHRHIDWIGTIGDTVLCSAPSVTMGLEKYRERFTIHEFTVSSKGWVRLTGNQRVDMSGATQALNTLDRSSSREAA